MKPILVSGRLVSERDYPEVRDALDVRWGPFLAGAGLVPILLPSRAPLARYLDIGDLAGVLLTGGNDLGAVCQDPLSEERDRREAELLDAVAARLPVLGVCRGLQLLAWCSGASIEPVEGHVGTRHPLDTDPGSRYLTEHRGHCANSYHGHGVTGIAPPYRAVAWSPDGAVEAIEHVSSPIVGIMWHPERCEPPAECDVRLFRRLFGTGPAR